MRLHDHCEIQPEPESAAPDARERALIRFRQKRRTRAANRSAAIPPCRGRMICHSWDTRRLDRHARCVLDGVRDQVEQQLSSRVRSHHDTVLEQSQRQVNPAFTENDRRL